VTPRERLEAALAAHVVDAVDELVRERVAAEVAAMTPASTPWLSIREAATYIGVSERTLERDLRNGRLRSSVVGRRRLLHRDDLDAYVRGDGGGRSANHATPPPRVE
jgi:excisionase family DNA binding protein